MERPILFKDEMVRAILAGNKAQTRRILDVPAGWSLEGPKGSPGIMGKITSSHPKRGRFGAFIRREVYSGSGKYQHDIVPCKYGEPGNRLWVREKFATHFIWDDLPPGHIDIENHADGFFYGDGTITSNGCEDHQRGKWRPSIHMPRFASRITLEITDVRVERLQDISETDASNEGAEPFDVRGFSPGSIDLLEGPEKNHDQPFRNGFSLLWESINGPGSWDVNPWVWVIEFRRVH